MKGSVWENLDACHIHRYHVNIYILCTCRSACRD